MLLMLLLHDDNVVNKIMQDNSSIWCCSNDGIIDWSGWNI